MQKKNTNAIFFSNNVANFHAINRRAQYVKEKRSNSVTIYPHGDRASNEEYTYTLFVWVFICAFR